MAIGAISNIYLLIFLPLIASLCCHILTGKNLAFWWTIFTSLLLLFLSLKIFPSIWNFEKITNDFQLSILSIALEFRLDLLGIIFLLLLLFIKTVTLFFFHDDVEKLLNDKDKRIFYAVFLLNLFAIIGILTANNLFNLFCFFEIYAFSFLALTSISFDLKLLKISFRYFCLSSLSSLIIIFSFFAIYLTFGEVNFDRIAENFYLLPKQELWFIELLLALVAFAVILRFFPFWLYFKKLRSSSLLASYMISDALFNKSLLGIFLTLKFTYFFFGSQLVFAKFDFDLLLLLTAISLIFYSSIKLYSQKHLKLICLYFSLNNLGFILASMALQSIQSLQALFFYLLNFSLVNFFIFIFATFLKNHFHSSSLIKVWLVRHNSLALVLPFKMLMFFIAALPLSFMFFANWYLAYSSFALGFEAFILAGLLVSNFVYVIIVIKLIDSFFSFHASSEMPILDIKNYRFYLAAFWFLITVIYLGLLASGPLNQLSLRFASFLLSNSI